MSAQLFLLPDSGSFEGVGVIVVNVRPGDTVRAEAPIITLESDKATMDIPARYAGVLATELQALSEVDRAGKLMPAQPPGGCFTISSLGGTAYTPIINVPEVAIPGVSRATMRPVYDGEGVAPRLMPPFAICYDHRLIDGVAGAPFAPLPRLGTRRYPPDLALGSPCTGPEPH
jgi:pyruvate/2-oxoglutarate dehydrogenase complex dihydrolipoamide acyltransferase (E2) component